MHGKTFSERVVDLARSVPSGRVTTYGDLARAAGGSPMTARSITGILAKAAKGGVHDIPWHRVVYSNGYAWLDSEHENERRKLYKKEGIEIDTKGRIIDFDILRY